MKRIVPLLLVLLFLITVKSEVLADGIAYGVKANIPENQIDKKVTYFDLLVKPGDTQSISLTITNSGPEEITLGIKTNTAATNKNGVIDYSKSGSDKDSSLEVNFSDIITGPEEITLSPKESKDVTYELSIPKEEFQGTVLGGFYIAQIGGESEQKQEENVQIKNEYSYVIAVKLTESDAKVLPELALNDVKPGLENYRTAVTANIQNIKPTIIDKLHIKAVVTEKGKETVIHQMVKDDMNMAPNSSFDFPINWDNKPLEPGTYTLKLEATSSEGEWEFEKDFKIDGAVSNKLNTEAVELEKDNHWIYIIIGALGLIMLGFIAVLLYRMKKLKSKLETDVLNINQRMK